MTVFSGFDAAGRRRSPATLLGYHAGRPPRNKGMRYPADPPTPGGPEPVLALDLGDERMPGGVCRRPLRAPAHGAVFNSPTSIRCPSGSRM